MASTSNNSNPSSEISIEEIGAEEIATDKQEDAEEIVTDDTVQPGQTQEDQEDQKQDEEDKDKGRASAGDTAAAGNPTRVLARAGGDVNDDEDDEDDDDFVDETFLERVAGLAEMFPESLRNGASSAACGAASGARWLYGAGRSTFFVVFSSAAILFLPVMIETERLGIEEMQKQQQRQILLGPGAAVSGGLAGSAAGQNAPLPPPAM